MKSFLTPILFLLAILCSCVFSPNEENFVEVDKNSTAPELSNQTLDFNSDTLNVWKNTKFNFDFKSSKQEITSVAVNYGDQKLTFQSSSGNFEINPVTFPEGIYTLEVKVYTKSGTGSLADKLGAEGYEFKKSCVLIIEKAKAPVINITSSIENGFLKFSWNKMDKPYFISYQLNIHNEGISYDYQQKFNNKNMTSFIDSFFVGGKVRLSLWVYYNDLKGSNIFESKDYTYDYPISVSLKEDFKNLTISWNRNPFLCIKYFELQGVNGTKISADTSYMIPAPGLGDQVRYNIAFKPLKKTLYDFFRYNNYNNYSLGENDQIDHKNVKYNPGLNRYFFKKEMKISSVNKNFVFEGSYDYYWDYNDKLSLEFSKDNQSIYSTVNQNLVKLSSSGLSLISSKKFPFTTIGNFKVQALKNLNDINFLACGNEFNFGSYLVIFNSINNTIIAKTDKLPYVDFENQYAVSENGKYIAQCYQGGMFIYEIINNEKLVLLYHDSNEYYSCFFDPKYPEKLIIDRPNDFQIFDCSKLQVEKTIDHIAGSPANIDPATHYLLVVSYSKKKMYVYDYENNIIKLEMNHHGYFTDFKLLNNVIFVNSGYHFDISPYVQ